MGAYSENLRSLSPPTSGSYHSHSVDHANEAIDMVVIHMLDLVLRILPNMDISLLIFARVELSDYFTRTSVPIR